MLAQTGQLEGRAGNARSRGAERGSGAFAGELSWDLATADDVHRARRRSDGSGALANISSTRSRSAALRSRAFCRSRALASRP